MNLALGENMETACVVAKVLTYSYVEDRDTLNLP